MCSNFFMKKILCATLLFGIVFPLQAKMNVVTTTQDLAAITTAIGGDLVDVISLTPGTRDPHFAEAKPSMVRKAYGADLLLLVGADLEVGWLPALLRSARNNNIQPGQPGYLDLSTAVELIGKVDGPVTRDMGDVHGAGNPHYWLNPANGIKMAKAISQRLIQLDAEHSEQYQQGYDVFSQTMQNKMVVWAESLKSLHGRPVIAYHTSFAYLAQAFSFEIVAQLEPKPGISPSVSHLQSLIKKIKSEQIALLIMEPYYEQRSARLLANKTKIRSIVLPQSVGAFGEIKSYPALFDSIVLRLTESS